MSERKTLTIAEAAEWLGIGKTLAYAMIREGTFPVRVIGLGTGKHPRRVVVRADLEAFLAGTAARALQTGQANGDSTAA